MTHSHLRAGRATGFTVAAAWDKLTDMEDTPTKPHPKNAPGPYYVVDGCCTACGVPVSEAPSVFSYDEANHCFVKRQPSTAREFDQTFRAAWAAELQCIRYRGNDPLVLRRFAELGEAHLCDVPPPPEIRPVVRDLVVFNANSLVHAGTSAYDLAEAFATSVRQRLQAIYQLRFKPIAGDETCATMTYAWFEEDYHSVEFRVSDKPDCRWLIRHESASRPSGRGVSGQIDEWLKADQRFCDIRWYTTGQWPRSQDWRDSPQ